MLSTPRTRRAGLLLGASEALREQVGLADAPGLSFHAQLLAPITGGPDGAALRESRLAGRELSAADAVALVS